MTPHTDAGALLKLAERYEEYGTGALFTRAEIKTMVDAIRQAASQGGAGGEAFGYVALYCGQKLFLTDEGSAKTYGAICEVIPVYRAACPPVKTGGGEQSEVQSVVPAGMKPVYLKRWRTIVLAPESIAAELVYAIPEIDRPVDAAQEAKHCGALASFFKWAMREGAWEGCDLDGGGIQDKAESLGLIVKTKFDPATHSNPHGDYADGDDYYEFAPGLSVPSASRGTEA